MFVTRELGEQIKKQHGLWSAPKLKILTTEKIARSAENRIFHSLECSLRNYFFSFPSVTLRMTKLSLDTSVTLGCRCYPGTVVLSWDNNVIPGVILGYRCYPGTVVLSWDNNVALGQIVK